MIPIKYLGVGFGGIIGSILRFFVGKITFELMDFPIGTLLVNVIGSFFLGFLTALTVRSQFISPALTASIGTGLIGSFTTFSTFSTEVVMLIQEQRYPAALIYIFISLLIGLLLAFYGYHLGNRPYKKREVC